ncbi:uncharacterized protein MELLADRAFT_88372 [Melampsora larici-populina 98AG31]|uniref:Uncharacterized protein n=1 Tax=Melampsora larici-populina (strain 98AG31 / pathotype 3-4-7) TaxID=747676 RepID=F4RRH2_MELLP|nr:uncharacterized protein MELLADRAFT_88372 [Melampsora larici-populina 98AG31]EGG04935.1 hypothetical protein MELLADRAFT_88372 [Melampsora larici-populina 98AG31]
MGVLTKELQDARDRIALHELTAQIFHEQAQKGTSGDGAILVFPWDPNYLYRLTWNGAWVWAKAVQNGMATREIPPRTYEYQAIMKKARVFHKATSVNDRVKMRSAQLAIDLSPTFHRTGGSRTSFFDPPAKLLFPASSSSKRSASFAGFSVSEHEVKPRLFPDDKKKIKLEPGSTSAKSKGITINLSSDPPSGHEMHIKKEIVTPKPFSKGVPIVISSDPPSPSIFESLGNNQSDYGLAASPTPGDLKVKDSAVEEAVAPISILDHHEPSQDPKATESAHAAALERFLDHCNVPKHDQTTRMILNNAGVQSWMDLIPSVQFTKTSLTARGMHPALASHLLSEALDRAHEL